MSEFEKIQQINAQRASVINSNFIGESPVEERISKAFENYFEKGKKLAVGTIRTHGGHKRIKTTQGWRPYKEGGKHHHLSQTADEINNEEKAARKKKAEAKDKKLSPSSEWSDINTAYAEKFNDHPPSKASKKELVDAINNNKKLNVSKYDKTVRQAEYIINEVENDNGIELTDSEQMLAQVHLQKDNVAKLDNDDKTKSLHDFIQNKRSSGKKNSTPNKKEYLDKAQMLVQAASMKMDAVVEALKKDLEQYGNVPEEFTDSAMTSQLGKKDLESIFEAEFGTED